MYRVVKNTKGVRVGVCVPDFFASGSDYIYELTCWVERVECMPVENDYFTQYIYLTNPSSSENVHLFKDC